MKTAIACLLACALPALTSWARGQGASHASQDVSSTNAPLIIPQPKSLHQRPGTFHLQPGVPWTLRAATRDERLWLAAQSVLESAAGSFQQSTQSWVSLTLGSPSHTNFPARQPRPQWAANPEGYRLTIDTNGLAILAGTAQGAFYGLQTLAQLRMWPEKTRSCPALEIEDWPSMRYRGVHWFPSASGLPMHLKLIQNVFGPLKFNHSVIQCEAARWDKYPEIAATNSISKPGLRRLADACRAHFIEPAPLINVPGHAEWIFRNGHNLDFAEDPETPYAYCVNHPKSFEFVQNVLNECLSVFEAKCCHLGHDEVTMRGRFPNPQCPRCGGATTTELLIKHANRLGEWLSRQGVETMIWGDMLLGPGEAGDATHAKTLEDAQQRRAGISRKTIIADWHYAAAVDARSLNIFRQDGFRVVAASFENPENIHSFSQAALAARAEGLLQTTWMGYFPDERALQTQLQQFTAFVLAAEYSWSGRKETPSRLGYDPKEVFLKAYAAGSR